VHEPAKKKEETSQPVTQSKGTAGMTRFRRRRTPNRR
jgi:hypothetical protein